MKQIIRRFVKRFEVMAMAVAYAEAGEWSFAEKIMDNERQRQHSGLDVKTDKKARKQTRMRL
jgi:hypothetical protein